MQKQNEKGVKGMLELYIYLFSISFNKVLPTCKVMKTLPFIILIKLKDRLDVNSINIQNGLKKTNLSQQVCL